MAAKKRTAADVRRARVLRERRKKLQIGKFQPKERSIRGRVAEFLYWAQERYPRQVVTYEEITQAIFSLGRVPTRTAKHVKSVRNNMSSAGKILMEKYRTSLVTVNGVGGRAAVDDADIARESVTKAAERHRQTAEKLKKTAELVNPKNLKEMVDSLGGDPEKQQELMEVSEWFSELMGTYIKALDKPRNAAALLPPPPAAV